MKKKQILLASWSIILLVFFLNPTVKASSLPPSSVPITNVLGYLPERIVILTEI
ncbi:hypothetical protein AB6878_16200 [Carnobacterium maltaromaticum]|uniref:hypothetical protein n=1 Tax=Carnobacterium maltaromaticum TaxID=2751 RepID=UPI0039BDCB48